MKPVLLKVVICLILVFAGLFLFKRYTDGTWILLPKTLESQYSISGLKKEAIKKDEAAKPAKILRRFTARIATKTTQKPPEVKKAVTKKVVSKARLSVLRKPRFTVHGAEYLLTLGIDNERFTLSYYHVFDSEGTTIIRNGQRVPADYRIFRHDGYEIDNFTYKRKPDRLIISVGTFSTTLPSKEALRRGLKPHAIARNRFTSKARNYVIEKGDLFNVRINMVTGLPDEIPQDDPRVTHYDVERTGTTNEIN